MYARPLLVGLYVVIVTIVIINLKPCKAPLNSSDIDSFLSHAVQCAVPWLVLALDRRVLHQRHRLRRLRECAAAAGGSNLHPIGGSGRDGIRFNSGTVLLLLYCMRIILDPVKSSNALHAESNLYVDIITRTSKESSRCRNAFILQIAAIDTDILYSCRTSFVQPINI